MKKLKLLLLLVISSLILTGCPQKGELEKLGIINTRGIDIDGDDKIKANFVLFQFEEQSQDFTNIVSGTGDTSTEAVNNANYEANFLLELGKVQVDLYGLETAKKGLDPYLDALNRYTKTPDTMYLAVSNTTAEEIIKMQEKDISMNIGQYLHDTIEQSSTTENQFPKMTLHKFMRYYKDIGRDPILPIFEIVGGKPKITSIGIFKDDKLVGRLPIHDRLLFNINYGRVKQGWLQFSVPGDSLKDDLKDSIQEEDNTIFMTLNIMNNKNKIKLLNKDNLEFEHSIKIEGVLVDLSIHESLDLEDPKVQKHLETAMKKNLKNRYEKLLNKLQELNSDPLGYGEIYRQNHREKKLTDKEWRKLYPDINVKYDIDVDLIRHGETF